MGISIFFIGLLLASLVASWAFFFSFLSKKRKQDNLLVKRSEEVRRHYQTDSAGMENLMGMMARIHRSAVESFQPDALGEIAKIIVECACQILHFPAGVLMMVEKDSNEMRITASKGLSEEQLAVLKTKMGEGVVGKAADTGKVVIVDNIETDARFVKENFNGYPSKAFVTLPLRIRNKTLGVLSVESFQSLQGFDERALSLLNLMADQCAITLENLRLYDNLQGFYMDIVETLSRALELKENVTLDPASYRRMRHYARWVAEDMNLPESIVKHIEFASVIYGIGKIGIDDAILRKPGKLSPEEFDQVKKHPEIGHRMVSRIKFLLPVTPMILYHQERWDGKGYPAGLKGEEIPLGSRIVAVINAFNAMTSDRPYRKALSEQQATSELKTGSGTQFDPKVVEAFVRILEKEKKNGNGN